MNTEHTKPLRVGAAFLFKQNNLQSGGVASIAGEAPFKFSTLDTLREAGGLWVVSTPEKTFLTEGGQSYPFLRHSGFMPTTLTALVEELMANSNEVNNLEWSAQTASEIFNRVVQMAQTLAPVAQALVGSDAKAPVRSLTSAFQQTMAPLLRCDPMPSELVTSMPSMFVSPPPFAGASGNDLVIRIPANRISLASTVLDQPVPGYRWREVVLSEYPNPLSWAVGGNEPVIAQVAVKGALPKVKSGAPLMSHLTHGATKWIALPELQVLSKIIDMRALKVFVAEQTVSSSASLKIPLPTFTPTGHASISAGLLAETYLHAACAPASQGDDKAMNGPHPQTHSIRAAWLLSAARALIVQEAMELSAAGFSVIGYGTSHVLVSTGAKNLKNLRKCLSTSKILAYPPGLREHENSYKKYADALVAKSTEGFV